MDKERIIYFRTMTSDAYVQSMLDECLDEIERLQARINNAIEEIEKTPTHGGTVLRWGDLYRRLMKALKGD